MRNSERIKKGREVGLRIKFKKAQIMLKHLADLREGILLEEIPIEENDRYIHLNQITTMNSKM